MLGLFVQPEHGVLMAADGGASASNNNSEGESTESTAAAAAAAATSSPAADVSAKLLGIGPLREAHMKLLFMGVSFVTSLMGLGKHLPALRAWPCCP